MGGTLTGAFVERLLDDLFTFIALLEVDGTVVDTNPGAIDAAIGEKLWCCPWFSDDVATSRRCEEACRRAAQGETRRFDAPVQVGPTSMAASIQIAPVSDEEGRVTSLVATAVDVSEQHERFREMADGLPLIIWVHDASGAQEMVNETFCEFFGVTRQEMRGGRWQALMHPDDAEGYARDFLAAVEAQGPFHAEVRVKDGRGEWRWIESWGRPRFTATGGFRGMVGTSADITERKRAEEALRDADRRKDEFLAMLGHELRNPLAAIRSATELVRVAAADDGRMTKVHGVLERQSRHMARLIDGLLEVTRIARGKIELEPEVLDAREVLAGVVDDRMMELLRSGLALEHDAPREPQWVRADPVRLTQVVDNLVGNAIKFTRAPGTLTVSVAPEGAEVVISVRDTGVGIRPEMLDTIFDPFLQEAQDIARSAGGLGLGLALVKGLVELHGGSVSAHSDGPGTGADFEVRLPRAAAPSSREASAAAPAPPQRRILLVEDNADAALMLRDLLELRGHDVTVSPTAAAALELVGRGGFDVVLCDIGLPDMSGYELARRLRHDLPSLRLVAVTGYGQSDDRDRAAESGFDAHLTKPVDLRALEAVLS